MKKFFTQFKFVGVFLLVMLFIAPVLVLASFGYIGGNGDNTTNNGYHIYRGKEVTTTDSNGKDSSHIQPLLSMVVAYRLTNNVSDNTNIGGACIVNNTKDTDFFIPTRTYKEWSAFFNNKPAFTADEVSKLAPTKIMPGDPKIFPVGCSGDGVCDPKFETCLNSPEDCGTCICNYNHTCEANKGETKDNCQDCVPDQPCTVTNISNGYLNSDCSIVCDNGYYQSANYCVHGNNGGQGCGGTDCSIWPDACGGGGGNGPVYSCGEEGQPSCDEMYWGSS